MTGSFPKLPKLRSEDGPSNVVLLGPPAGGKGTQADFLSQHYGMVHVSTGDLLRARAKFLPEVDECMNTGKLVPDEVVSAILRERLQDADCTSKGVLLDGFPRTRAQAESLRASGIFVTAVLHLDVLDDVVIERISGRRIDPLSGKVYHTKYNPAPADIAGRLIHRSDDTLEKIQTRLRLYHAERDAILSFYGDKLVKTVHVGGHRRGTLPGDVRPLLVFDEVRKALEGDTYYGALIRSELIVKAYECGTHAASLATVSRFFEHSRYRMVHNGVLADSVTSAGGASVCTLRAQVVQLAERLTPLARYELRAWLNWVGDHVVVVGHTISQRLANGDVVDIARGYAALIFLSNRGVMLPVPGVERLREFVAPTEALWGHSPVNDIRAPTAGPGVVDSNIGTAPNDCWTSAYCVPAIDIDVTGTVHQAACLALFERVRFDAAAGGGYPQSGERVLRSYTTRAYVAYLGRAQQGDRVETLTWEFSTLKAAAPDLQSGGDKPTLDLDVPEGSICLAFETRRKTEDGSAGGTILLRGALVVMPRRETNETLSRL